MYPGPVSWTHEGYGIGSNRKNSPNTQILVGRKKEGESLSITRDRQPRLWSTIGQLLILVVKRKPIPNSLCLQLGTVPCYAIWSRFEIPFLAATFLLSQPDWNLVHFRYLSFIDPAYTYFLLLRASGRACTSQIVYSSFPDFPYYSISRPVYQQEQQLLFKEPHVPRAPQEPQQLICDWHTACSHVRL